VPLGHLITTRKVICGVNVSVPVIIAVEGDTMDLLSKNLRVGCGERLRHRHWGRGLGRRLAPSPAEIFWEVLPRCRVCRREDPLSGEAQIADSNIGPAYRLSTRLSVSPRRCAPRRNGNARHEGPSRRGTVFILRPAGPKVEARRAEAKFWVWSFVRQGSEPDTGSAQVIMPNGVS